MKRAAFSRVALIVSGIVLTGITFSSLDPILAIGMENQLEGQCAHSRFESWTYHRSSWTPVRWSCTVVDKGRTREIRPGLSLPWD